jgi:hypothetical protein
LSELKTEIAARPLLRVSEICELDRTVGTTIE